MTVPLTPDEPSRQPLGGTFHTYLGFDAVRFGSARPSDAAGAAAKGAFEHMLATGSMRRFTDEELANAVRIDPSQIQGLGPSIESLIELLEARKAKILATFDPAPAAEQADHAYRKSAERAWPQDESDLRRRLAHAIKQGQLRDLERLWYRLPEGSAPQRALTTALERLRERYQVDAMRSRHTFTGREALSVERALEVADELERIERLLEQLREALRNAKPAIIDLDALSEFAPQEQVDSMRDLQRRVNELLERMAEEAGLSRTPEGGWKVSPRAMRLYQRGLLATIFSDLQAARSGRHQGVTSADGAVELPATRPWAFGDSPSAMDLPQSLLNAMVREASAGPRVPGAPVRLRGEDMVVHRTRQQPKCATAVILDMSGSMRHGGQYMQAKRMAMALEGLIRSEYPGDFLQFIEMYTVARLRAP
ncbi:MAG: hypothetical protein EBQ99_06090, partial [Planctomycetes bacterium]|nr:hypothetical protein [Planctomycetota bacterium]